MCFTTKKSPSTDLNPNQSTLCDNSNRHLEFHFDREVTLTVFGPVIHQFRENGDICSVTFVLTLRISLSGFLGALLSVLRNNLLRDRIRNALLNLMVNSKLTLICSSTFGFLLETAPSAFHALRHLPGAGIGTLVSVWIPRVQGLSVCGHLDYSSNHRKLRTYENNALG